MNILNICTNYDYFTEKTNKTAPFPGCCPKFVCEDGAKLEYPELPKPQEEATDSTTTKTKA